MRTFILSLLTAVLLSFTLFGLAKLFDYPIALKKTPTSHTSEEKQAIIIYDHDQSKLDGPECVKLSKQISQLFMMPQLCETNEDCATRLHSCGKVLNKANYDKYHQLKNRQAIVCRMQLQSIPLCPHQPPSSSYCVNKACVALENTNTDELIDKFIHEHKKATQN